MDSEDPIDLQDLANNQHPDVDNIEKVGEQLYRVLCHSYTGESEDLVVGAGNGYEAHRKFAAVESIGRSRHSFWRETLLQKYGKEHVS